MSSLEWSFSILSHRRVNPQYSRLSGTQPHVVPTGSRTFHLGLGHCYDLDLECLAKESCVQRLLKGDWIIGIMTDPLLGGRAWLEVDGWWNDQEWRISLSCSSFLSASWPPSCELLFFARLFHHAVSPLVLADHAWTETSKTVRQNSGCCIIGLSGDKNN